MCGHRWLHPMPTEAELTSYYNSSYMVAQARYSARVHEEFPLVQQLVNHQSAEPGKMLEIGCSYGDMLDRFAAAGWDVEGVEVDARAAAHARDALGIAVHEGTLDQVSAHLRAPYDVVTMFHVIEHVVCVTRLVERLAELTAPGGLLLIKTPNAASLMSRILRGWWQWSAVPEHVHLFTRTSLRAILGRAGFTEELSITRRGDAHGTLHELTRGGLRRLAPNRPLGERIFEAAEGNGIAPTPVSSHAAYKAVARVLDAASKPLDWLLEAASRTSNAALQPELVVLARRSDSGA